MAKKTKEARMGVFTGPANTEGAQGGADAGAFPRDFANPSSRRDTLMNLKKTYATGDRPYGDVQATDSDMSYIMDKAKEAEEADFDAWFGQNYALANLADRQVAQDLNPEYFDARERKMVQRTKLALKINLIGLRGPKSEEDMLLLYGLNTGRIKLGEGWDRVGFGSTSGSAPSSLTTAANIQQQFKSQLYAPSLFVQQNPRQANVSSNSDTFGNGTAAAKPGFGATSATQSAFWGKFLSSVGQGGV